MAYSFFFILITTNYMKNNSLRANTQNTAIYDGWHVNVVSQCFLTIVAYNTKNGWQAHVTVSGSPSSQDAEPSNWSWERRWVRSTSPFIEVGRLTHTTSPDTAETGDYISVVRHLVDSRKVTASDNVRFE